MPKIKWGQVAVAYLVGSFFGVRDLIGLFSGGIKANGRAA
jgi:hypothetical protein